MVIMPEENDDAAAAAPESRADTGDATRDEQGRFLPGKTGNAGGRPRTVKEAQDEAGAYVSESITTLVTAMRWCMTKPTVGRVREARQCAVAIMNRALGMPAQPISGVPGQPLNLSFDGLLNELKKIAGEE